MLSAPGSMGTMPAPARGEHVRPQTALHRAPSCAPGTGAELIPDGRLRAGTQASTSTTRGLGSSSSDARRLRIMSSNIALKVPKA